eukprot:TRINITY_DN267_c0_g1_i2.p1 TRINITY_DN267_c0_g1~~TRINITY_DN267_c0_g1_i2.p1  ORF type:complete len:440 (+),score=134.30 TRINITY_DN267_c0_g1_i2:1003-2322(+)
MKRIVASKTELNLLESEDSSRKPKKTGMLESIEDPLKQEFEDRLKIMGDFSEAEKNKVKDDFETELLNMEYILASEREQQEITVRRLIQQRRKRVTDRKKEIENFNASLLSPDEEIIKQNVEKEIDEEMRDRTRDIEARTIAKLDGCKEAFMKKLGISKSLSEKEKNILLRKHHSELDAIYQEVSNEKIALLEELESRMSKRKHTLLAEKILTLREELHPELNLEPCDDVAEISIPQEILNSSVIGKLNSEEQDKLQELSRKHEEQSKKQKKAHTLEITEKEEELEEDLEMDVEKEIESRKEKLEQNYRFKQQKLEEQRRNIRDQLLFVSRDKEVAQKLHEEIQKKDEELQELIENEKKETDCLLDERINRRKIAKQRKLLGFKNSQLNKSIAVSYTHLTLPTILLVQISVVAVSLKKKKKQHSAVDITHHDRQSNIGD